MNKIIIFPMILLLATSAQAFEHQYKCIEVGYTHIGIKPYLKKYEAEGTTKINKPIEVRLTDLNFSTKTAYLVGNAGVARLTMESVRDHILWLRELTPLGTVNIWALFDRPKKSSLIKSSSYEMVEPQN
jgi:hypothetical protein